MSKSFNQFQNLFLTLENFDILPFEARIGNYYISFIRIKISQFETITFETVFTSA